MKSSLKLGGKITRATLRLLIMDNLKPGLSRLINIGLSPMRCVWLISRQTFRQPLLIHLKLIISPRGTNSMLRLMYTRSLIGSEKILNLSMRKKTKKVTKKFTPGPNWRRCSDVREATDLSTKSLRQLSIVSVLLKKLRKKMPS
jgi:hypothetical protein